MFALANHADESAALCPDDPRQLAQGEAALLTAEAQLEARAAELLGRERASAAQLAQQRSELKGLAQARAGVMAIDALDKLPIWTPRTPEPGPERLEALTARRAALEARQRALVAEEQELRLREETLVRLDHDLLELRQLAAAVRQKSQEILEAEKRSAEHQRRENARPPALPPRPPADAMRPTSAPRPVASGAIATGLEEAARPEKSNKYDPHRRARRVTLQANVDLYSDTNFYTGFSSDLSDGGIFVATCNILDEGTEVDIAFTLPGNCRIEARGIVRWLREFNDQHPDVAPGMGIEFVEMPDDSRHAVHAFTSKREPIFWVS